MAGASWRRMRQQDKREERERRTSKKSKQGNLVHGCHGDGGSVEGAVDDARRGMNDDIALFPRTFLCCVLAFFICKSGPGAKVVWRPKSCACF